MFYDTKINPKKPEQRWNKTKSICYESF